MSTDSESACLCLTCDRGVIKDRISSCPAPVHGKTLELYELLCHYFRLSATDRPSGIEKMTLFCPKCLQFLVEILKWHKEKVALEKKIMDKIKLIEKSIYQVHGQEKKETSKESKFRKEFREKIRCRSYNVKVKLRRLEEENLGKSKLKVYKPFKNSMSIVPEVEVKQEYEETTQDLFFPEADYSFLQPDSEENSNNYCNEKEDSLPMEIDPTEFLELTDEVATTRRSLRPRRKNNQQNPPGFENIVAKHELEDEIYEDGVDPLAMSGSEFDDYDENYYGTSDGRDSEDNINSDQVNNESSSESEWSVSTAEESDDNWKSNLKQNRKPRRGKSGQGRNQIKDRVKKTEDGKYTFKQVNFTKTETNSGFQFSCELCNYNVIVTETQLQTKTGREGVFTRIKCHVQKLHVDSAFKCPFTDCTKSFATKKSLNRHKRRHTNTEPRSVCEICGKHFKSKNYKFLAAHMWSHKSEEEKQAAIEAGEKAPLTHRERIEETKRNNPERYPCPQCNMVFNWNSHFLRHFARRHEGDSSKKCQKCSLTFLTVGDLNIHKRSVCEKDNIPFSFLCSYCDKRFETKEKCEKHEQKHEKPFSCDKCSKSFVSEKILQSHIEKCDGTNQESQPIRFEGFEFFHEVDETGFILRCGSCPFIVEHINFKHDRCESNRKMHVHIRGKHAGKYQCNICQKLLSEPKSLKNHMRIHNNNLPQDQCPVCQKPFKSRVTQNKPFFKSHLWTHFSEEEKQERIANGEMPPLTYSEKLQLTKNAKMQTQSAFQCQHCGKTFPWESNLKKHERTHQVKEGLQEKTFQCSYCGKFYASQDYLNYHVKHVHEQNKLHTWHYCSFSGCSRKFSQLNGLKKHQRSHERGNGRSNSDANFRKRKSTAATSSAGAKRKIAASERAKQSEEDSNSSSEGWNMTDLASHSSSSSTPQHSAPIPLPLSMMQHQLHLNQFLHQVHSIGTNSQNQSQPSLAHFSNSHNSSNLHQNQGNQRLYEDGNNVYQNNYF